MSAAPWWEGPLLGFDLETTGTDPFTADPVSWALVYDEPGQPPAVFSGLVRCPDPIPAEATAVHGITDAMLADDGEEPEEVIPWLAWQLVSSTVPVVGMNLAYDLTIVQRWFRGDLGTLATCGPILDVAVLDKQADPFRKGRRRLTDLCELYDVSLADAHDASADALASVSVFRSLAARYEAKLLRRSLLDGGDPVSAYSLHDKQVGWRAEQLASLSAHFEKVGRGTIPMHERTWPVLRAVTP